MALELLTLAIESENVADKDYELEPPVKSTHSETQLASIKNDYNLRQMVLLSLVTHVAAFGLASLMIDFLGLMERNPKRKIVMPTLEATSSCRVTLTGE
uniref:Uncharacterized protein n=1 Tax=Cannabis sativa TaxID=3483 RepID=A0A803PT26_CANSA